MSKGAFPVSSKVFFFEIFYCQARCASRGILWPDIHPLNLGDRVLKRAQGAAGDGTAFSVPNYKGGTFDQGILWFEKPGAISDRVIAPGNFL
jgi:hypothetical protein